MVRRRTAMLFVTAAALVALSPLIASCGTPHAGAAAVVGGKAISETALQGQVAAVRAAQGATPQAAQLIESTSDLDRTLLGSMVSDEVLDRAVADAGLTVTRRDAQQLEAAAELQAGGAQALQADLLQQYAVAPGNVSDFYRIQAEARAFAQHLGADLATPAGQQAVTQALARTSRELRVDVNPRYGAWNAQTLSLGPAPEPWVRTVGTSVPIGVQG